MEFKQKVHPKQTCLRCGEVLVKAYKLRVIFKCLYCGEEVYPQRQKDKKVV